MNRVMCGPVVVAVLMMMGCNSSSPVAPVSAAPPPVEHAAPPPYFSSAADIFVASGPLVVERQVDVAALREGVVSALLADVGMPAKKGQLLARLDDRQIMAQRDAAAAKVISTREEARTWDADLKVLEADLARSEKLFAISVITQEQLDHARYKVEVDKHEVERMRQDLIAAQENLKSLDLELDKTRIVAPFEGVVARRYVREGQKVSVGDRLFWITATGPLEVRFTLPERYVLRVQRGDLLSLSSPDVPDQKHAARVTEVSPVIDPASGTIEVKAQVTGTPVNLRPGMMARIEVPKLR
jgi:RND family efflux transporter MFP subunit